MLAVLSRPLLPSAFLRAAPDLGPLLANGERTRAMWCETAQELLNSLG